MLAFIHFSLLLSITLTSCGAEEVDLRCGQLTEEKYNDLSRVINVCNLYEFRMTGNNTKFSFENASQMEVTALQVVASKFRVFPQQILDIFPQIVVLEVNFNEMTKIDDHSFRNASQLLEINVEVNKLTEITEYTFAGAKNLISLHVGSNEITSVSPMAFIWTPKMEKLILSGNKITLLDRDTFASLKHLKYLDASNNKLTAVDPQLFVHNEVLLYLNLERNEFNTVELELRTNELHRLDFDGLEKLTLRRTSGSTDLLTISLLDLEACKFTNMSDLVIDEMIHVSSIDMSRNKLTSLIDAPEYLRHVTHLQFKLNTIDHISEDFMKQLVNLKSLKLDNTKLKMAPNMFEHLPNLVKLDVSQNDLRKLEPEWFTGLGKLEELEFQSNNVTNFDYMSLLETLPALKILNIRGANDFKCDYLKKMVRDLKEVNRLDVIKGKNYSEEDERGNYIYNIRCDRHLKDRDGFSYSYLKYGSIWF